MHTTADRDFHTWKNMKRSEILYFFGFEFSECCLDTINPCTCVVVCNRNAINTSTHKLEQPFPGGIFFLEAA